MNTDKIYAEAIANEYAPKFVVILHEWDFGSDKDVDFREL